MKKSFYKSGLFLAAALLAVSGNITAQPVTKEYHKEYSAKPGSSLNISNRYGDVNIDTWDEERIVIDVKVSVELPDRNRAERYLSYIEVQFSENGNEISAKTVIDDKFSFSGWGSRSRKFSINYSVRMPSGCNLDLTNRYGNTDIDDINGHIRLDIKYGNINAGSLTRGNEKPLNTVILGYGKGTIGSAGWLDVFSRYSGSLIIDRSQALLLNSRYSKIQIGETSSVVGESKYDNLRIGKINNLVLESGYSDIAIGTLTKKLKFEGGYGAFMVENIPAGFETIETDTRYIGVKLGIDNDADYELDARLSYGNLKFNEDNFQHRTRIVENNSSQTAGFIGKSSSPSSKVTVKASYGSVRLTQ